MIDIVVGVDAYIEPARLSSYTIEIWSWIWLVSFRYIQPLTGRIYFHNMLAIFLIRTHVFISS